MATLNEFFHPQAEMSLHPRLRDWKRRLAQGVKAQLELYRPSTALGLAQTELNLHFIEANQPQSLETMAWDDDLNAGLIELGVRAIDMDQEAERFSLGLRAALRKAERDFGDGYFNSVLFELISENDDLTRDSEIADVLKHAYALAPNHDGRSYGTCREMIRGAISGRARELTEKLRYSEDEAKNILVKALARYLDERFSVSSRRRMGLL